MRLLKAQNTNRRTIYGRGVQFDVDDQVYMESTNSIRVPKGTTAERPAYPENGQMRYNTEANEFEFYVNNAWEDARTMRPNTITVQNLGTGDATNQEFGPLNPTPATAANVLVLVENVVQIAGVNYTMIQGQGGQFLRFDSAVPLGKDVVVIHGFD